MGTRSEREHFSRETEKWEEDLWTLRSRVLVRKGDVVELNFGCQETLA